MQDVVNHLLNSGSIAVIPTDTVYGVVARASDQQAVASLYELKHREHKPGTLVAASVDQLVELGIPRRYLTAVQQFWPGAVSVVLPSVPALAYLDQGVGTLAVRIPDDAKLQQILDLTGPLVTSSANTPGQPPANTINDAKAYFGDAVPYYLDGGDLAGRAPSTLIRIIDDSIEVLRQGAVPIKPTD